MSTTTPTLTTFLTPRQIGESLQLHEKTIKQMAARGEFEGAIKVCGKWRIPQFGLDAMLKASVVTPDEGAEPVGFNFHKKPPKDIKSYAWGKPKKATGTPSTAVPAMAGS